MIESVNVVRNGTQIRMYHLPEVEALKYYIPVRPAVAGPIPGVVPAPTPAPAPAPVPTGMMPGAGEAAAAPGAPTGEVPKAVAAGIMSPSVEERKPIQGLTKEEIQAGLAMGQYTQDDEGNVFQNPDWKDPDPRSSAAPNHKIDIKSADQ